MPDNFIPQFEKLYGAGGDIRCYFAPGRVNLIGEHTDYNGGHVLPCALTLGTYAVARKREDKKLRFYSANFPEEGMIETGLDDLVPSDEAGWTNYPKGVLWTLEKNKLAIPNGMDIFIYGNIPNGSGLSSSASLEVLTGLLVKDLFELPVSMTELALLGQYSENHFNGCNCGIMDQFASAMGKKDHCIFLDTNTLKYEYVPIVLKNEKVVITNSKVKHNLVDSAYNDRRRECEAALEELKQKVDITSLGQLSEEQFEKYKDVMKNQVRQKRAKHAVYENQRTIQAMNALKENNVKRFGELMNASHISLRDDYEVSCEEIDFLVEMAWNTPGVAGSRMTGGGFGGCTVSIVENEALDGFVKSIGEAYKNKTGHEAEFYVAGIGEGAHRLDV